MHPVLFDACSVLSIGAYCR